MQLFNLGAPNLDAVSNFSMNVVRVEGANNFTPIGIGKPLAIRMHTCYVADLKNGANNRRKRSVLVTSQIKDDMTYAEAPRAIHQIYDNVRDRRILHPTASNKGTELIYYTPALDTNVLLINIEITADRFRGDFIDDITSAFNQAAALPVFAPFASSVVVGSKLLKVTSDIFERIIENDPLLDFDYRLTDDVAGDIDTVAGVVFGCREEDKDEFRKDKYEIRVDRNNRYVLVEHGETYKGDHPYVILSVDGAEREAYKEFQPALASAAIMKKFYGINENKTVDDLGEIAKIYNDYQLIKNAKDYFEKAGETSDAKRKEEYLKLYEANKKNIVDDYLLQLLNNSEIEL